MFIVYFAGVVGGISAFLGSMAFYGVLIAIFCAIMYMILWSNKRDPSKVLKRTLVTAMILSTLSGGFQALMPSEKTVYMMLGAYAAQSALQSETAGKVMLIVNQKLDQYLTGAENAK